MKSSTAKEIGDDIAKDLPQKPSTVPNARRPSKHRLVPPPFVVTYGIFDLVLLAMCCCIICLCYVLLVCLLIFIIPTAINAWKRPPRLYRTKDGLHFGVVKIHYPVNEPGEDVYLDDEYEILDSTEEKEKNIFYSKGENVGENSADAPNPSQTTQKSKKRHVKQNQQQRTQTPFKRIKLGHIILEELD